MMKTGLELAANSYDSSVQEACAMLKAALRLLDKAGHQTAAAHVDMALNQLASATGDRSSEDRLREGAMRLSGYEP